MTMPERTLPTLLRRLFETLVPEHERDDLLGDLEERFVRHRTRHGHEAAVRWYRREVLQLTVAIARLRVRHGLRIIGNRWTRHRSKRTSNRERVMSGLVHDLRYAARSLRRAPLYSAMAAGTLALGVGAATAMFALVNAVLLGTLPYPEPASIVRLYETYQRWNGISASPANFIEWRDRNGTFQDLAARDDRSFNVSDGVRPERVHGAQVTANTFQVLGVDPILGRGFRAEDDAVGATPVAMLSYSYWQRRFGGVGAAIGAELLVDNVPHTIVGVMPRDFRVFGSVAHSLWTPGVLSTPAATDTSQSFRWHWLSVVGRLRDGLDPAQAELDAIASRLAAENPQSNDGWGVVVKDLREDLVGGTRPALAVLFGSVGILLVIGCANVANLMLARAGGRRREIVVRMALGASRARAVQLMLAEGFWLALAGAGVGAGLAFLAVEGMVPLIPFDLPFVEPVRISGIVVLFSVCVAVAGGMVASVVPVVRLSRADVDAALRIGGSRGEAAGAGRFRQALVALESGLVVLLLIGAGLMTSSWLRLGTIDPGFETAGKLTFGLDLSEDVYSTHAELASMYHRVAEEVAGLPGVEHVGVTTALPLQSGRLAFPVHVKGMPTTSTRPPSHVEGVSAGYRDALGLRQLAGRWITTADRSAPVAVVTQSLAQALFDADTPIGHAISITDSIAGPWYPVVGVVSDIKHEGLASTPSTTVYLPMTGMPFLPTSASVVATATFDDSIQLISAVRKRVLSIDPNQPIDSERTYQEIVSRSLASPRFRAVLLGLFGGMALCLGAVGVFGVVSYTVSQQMRDLGIRVALGATPGAVARLVFRASILPVALGSTAGLIVARALAHRVDDLVYDTASTDATIFAAAGVTVLLMGILASGRPAWRATRIDPAGTLRAE